MKILSIESSCDETAAAVVEDGRTVLSDIVASQVEEHKLYGGVVPEIASRRHCEAISQVVTAALTQAKTDLNDIDAIAVTACPGLIGALLVGVNFAKGLAFSADKPLIPVHHLRSHIAANYVCHPQLKPPFLALVVSGGHTSFVKVKDYTDFEIIGATRDDAAGEALDKAARAIGLPYPGGLHMDKAAADGNEKAFVFPNPKVDNAPYDCSFSGLKTSVINLLHNAQQKGENVDIKDLSASYLHAVVHCLTQRTEMALDEFGFDTLVLAGGVSANSILRCEMQKLCNNKGVQLFYPTLNLCGDNAAMVGAQAFYEYQAGHLADLSLNAKATCEIDNIDTILPLL
ncbi:MAG: tRNA (adenosine(37)-N6)-threonylcarbamoyltransferase complex transferase subunit TsaD [Ruminococcaceae bacterium]|nr:tRNA (adenosine(37)-N6)-threonylcarbamoyltransferase complex transferase subunit TsaD [Oscillospiraceae bacterium]